MRSTHQTLTSDHSASNATLCCAGDLPVPRSDGISSPEKRSSSESVSPGLASSPTSSPVRARPAVPPADYAANEGSRASLPTVSQSVSSPTPAARPVLPPKPRDMSRPDSASAKAAPSSAHTSVAPSSPKTSVAPNSPKTSALSSPVASPRSDKTAAPSSPSSSSLSGPFARLTVPMDSSALLSAPDDPKVQLRPKSSPSVASSASASFQRSKSVKVVPRTAVSTGSVRPKSLWQKAGSAAGISEDATASRSSRPDMWDETLSLWEAEKARLREESKRIECEMYAKLMDVRS